MSPNNLFMIKKVSPEGSITGLEGANGSEYILIRRPAALDKGKEILGQVRSFVMEHKRLSERQMREFSERYGNPAEKAKGYASRLTPEEFQRRGKEFNEYVQKRFEDLSSELESRYEKLELEFESTVERIFGREAAMPAEPAPAESAAAPSPEALTVDAAATDVPAADVAGKPKKMKKTGN